MVRRAASGRDGSYHTRVAQLEFHARLAGSVTLADAFARPMPDVGRIWEAPWRAGGQSAAIPDGDPMNTKAVLPVAWSRPAALVIDEKYNAEVIDLVTRSPLGPRVGLRTRPEEGPDDWAAREIAGSVHLVVSTEDGEISLWCLAGPSASPERRASGRSPEAIRAVEVFPGPGGIPLVAALTADRPGHLRMWTVATGGLQPIGQVLGGDRIIGLEGTATEGKLVISSLSNGLRTVQISAMDQEPTVVTRADGRSTLLAAEGSADDALALISRDERILAVTIAGDDADVDTQDLGEGGPSARPAFYIEPARATPPSSALASSCCGPCRPLLSQLRPYRLKVLHTVYISLSVTAPFSRSLPSPGTSRFSP
jgi:hypothetical protein